MAYFGKVFTLEKNENFEGFINSLGLPKEKVDSYVKSKSSQKIEKDGDGYIITSTTSLGVTEMKFKPGVEFDQQLVPEIVTKNVITVDGDKFTQVQKAGGKTITYVREFSPDNLVVTITSDFWDGVAKRIYV
ncbi:unnamed protein product [Pieris macdunnoughi]|uniref:Lipocalin/cytosolic fatty-acid binding domain-containing protein n=1 Tax=Pieris macdunnoughi TaxID=345717 RepID=A0A821PFD1_9NEOP|nr:unnamed protein product [Pieris macdunnoughi]